MGRLYEFIRSISTSIGRCTYPTNFRGIRRFKKWILQVEKDKMNEDKKAIRE
jgi:hypothetical protein